MLVLTRTEGQEVVIGDPRKPLGIVRISSVKGERVRIGFDFPADVEIHRSEVAQAIVDKGPEPAKKAV